jgi:hypothetical protein
MGFLLELSSENSWKLSSNLKFFFLHFRGLTILTSLIHNFLFFHSQLFNVTVLTPPKFLLDIQSKSSHAIASVFWNVSVTGNPKPELTW